jgi:hypothetical protein
MSVLFKFLVHLFSRGVETVASPRRNCQVVCQTAEQVRLALPGQTLERTDSFCQSLCHCVDEFPLSANGVPRRASEDSSFGFELAQTSRLAEPEGKKSQ